MRFLFPLILCAVAPALPTPLDARTLGLDQSVFDSGAAQVTGARLEDVLRDYGDIRAVAEALPTETAGDPRLQALRALALAGQGQTESAAALLAASDAARATGWGQVASAMIARDRGDLDNAEALITGVTGLDPSNAYAHNVVGTIAARRGDWAGAERAFATAARLGPDSALYHANLGNARFASGSYAAAQASLSRAIALNPTSCPALIGRSEVKILQGQMAGARADLEACLASAAPNPEAALRLVRLSIERGALSEAQTGLTRHATLIGPRAAPLTAELALRRGDGAAARAALATARDLPEDLRHLSEAYAWVLDGDIAQARASADMGPQDSREARTLRRALALLEGVAVPRTTQAETPTDRFLDALDAQSLSAPDRRRALAAATDLVPGFHATGLPDTLADLLAAPELAQPLARGALYLDRALYGPAALAFSQAEVAAAQRDASPDTAGAQALAAYLRASSLSLANDLPGAEDALRAAVRAMPGFAAAQFFLGETLARSGRFAEALPAYRAADALAPTAATALRVGMAAEAAGAIDTAESAYRDLIARLPDSHVGYNQLAWLLVSQGRKLSEAETLARTALTFAPEDPAIKDTLGWTLYKLGEPHSAVHYLRQAHLAGTSASAPLIAFHLATVEAALGNEDAARGLLDLILREGNDSFVFWAEAQSLRAQIN